MIMRITRYGTSSTRGARSKEQGARSKEQGARSKEQGARSKEQGARSKDNVDHTSSRKICSLFWSEEDNDVDIEVLGS
jgi:hypothetical protein